MVRPLLLILSLATVCHGFLSPSEESLLNTVSRQKRQVTPTQVPVVTPLGTIIGLQNEQTNVFLGVPYAKPPRRWQNPEYPDVSVGDILAVDAGPMCAQVCPPGFDLLCHNETSEDCLKLNIFQPFGASSDNRKPVVIFIHGGQFSSFSGTSSMLYYGEPFANKTDVVYVTINYRLGAMGFLATGEGPNDLKGNYGLEDQKMAMRWVKNIIPYFGGDPNKITLLGHSSGGTSVLLHMLDSSISNLFHRAVVQSSQLAIPFKNYDDAKFQTQTIAFSVGCPTGDTTTMINCMKTRTKEQIESAQFLYSVSQIDTSDSYSINNEQMWGPVINGDTVPSDLVSAFKNITDCRKDLIIGATTGESFIQPQNVSYIKLLDIFMNDNRDIIPLLDLYPPASPLDATFEFAEATTDLIYVCPTRKVARYLDKGLANVFLYLFDVSIPGASLVLGSQTLCDNKACHGADLIYLLQLINFIFSPDELKVAEDMATYWKNFFYTGDPNDMSLRKWKRYRYRRASKRHLVFNTDETKSKILPEEDVCNYWDEEGYHF